METSPVTEPKTERDWRFLVGLDTYGVHATYLDSLATKLEAVYGHETIIAQEPILVFKAGDNAFYRASVYIPELLDEYLKSQIIESVTAVEAAKLTPRHHEFEFVVRPNIKSVPVIKTKWNRIESNVVLFPGDLVIHDCAGTINEVYGHDAVRAHFTIINKGFLARVHAASHALGFSL